MFLILLVLVCIELNDMSGIICVLKLGFDVAELGADWFLLRLFGLFWVVNCGGIGVTGREVLVELGAARC